MRLLLRLNSESFVKRVRSNVGNHNVVRVHVVATDAEHSKAPTLREEFSLGDVVENIRHAEHRSTLPARRCIGVEIHRDLPIAIDDFGFYCNTSKIPFGSPTVIRGRTVAVGSGLHD